MTTTILGANGNLGSMLARFAAKAGLGWQTQSRSGTSDVIWTGAMDDPASDGVFTNGATLINMIGYTGHEISLLQDTNVDFVRDLLAKAKRTGAAHVVLASSAAVYGSGDGIPFNQSGPLKPVTPYATSKVAMETVAQEFAAENDGPAITILRIGNVCGADALGMFAKRHIAAGSRMPLHRFSDGSTPVRSYIGPRDLFRAVSALSVDHDGPLRIFNVAHPQHVSLEDVLVAYRTHLLPDLQWADTAAPKEALRTVILSTIKLNEMVEFQEFDDPAAAMAHQVKEAPDR